MTAMRFQHLCCSIPGSDITDNLADRFQAAPFSFPDAGVKIAAPTPPELRVAVGGGFTINTGHLGDFDRTGWTLRENLTYIRGAHELHFGSEAVHIKVNVRNAYHQSEL